MLNCLKDIRLVDERIFLGEGAFSQVQKVISVKDGKTYALKRVDVSSLSPAEVSNLRNEIALHKTLNHANIIQFVDCLQIGNQVYILLEYAGNGSVFFYIHSREGLPESLALRFFYQAALAVKYLHEHKIVHRDIKPENILLDNLFNVKICDFGWSCYLPDNMARTSICGTYEYMPPEIVNDQNSCHTSKVDIWCLGILLYELLHGDLKRQSSLPVQERGENKGRAED